MFDLHGRVALVTGAGQGVGEGIARALTAHGASVAVNDFYEDRAKRVAAELERAVAAPADVTDRAAVDAMVAAVESDLGPVDILVNNAGIPPDGFILRQFRDSTVEEWDRFVQLNLYGVLHCCHAVIDGMCDRGHGRIITVSSEAARTGMRTGLALYGAAKAAALGFGRHLAAEVARQGVTVNAVALGSMTSPGADPAAESRGHPVGRRGVPEDVAAAVVYLASDEAGWVTAQTFGVNGGVYQT